MNDGHEVRKEALLGMLQVAVMNEMSQVTDASMDLFRADHDYHAACLNRADTLSRRRREIWDAAETRPSTGLTPEEQEESDQLAVEIGALHAKARNIPVMAVHHYGDDLLCGGKHCAKTFAALAVSLAHMAHTLGGVTFAGLHWCAGSGHMGTQDPYPCAAEVRREQAEEAV